MKKCMLCKSMANVYCDSDRASLCWTCDAKVHSANFLVARHSRSLLCQVCQSPTPWSASGKKLWPSTASICGRCVVEDISDDDDNGEERFGGHDGCDGAEYGDELELGDSVEENNSQVLPWSSTPPPPPPAATSSSSSKEFCINGGASLNRKRQKVSDLSSKDDLDCSSAIITHLTSSSPIVEPSTEDVTSFQSTQSSSEATAGEHKRIRQRNNISGDYICESVLGTSKSKRIADFDLNLSP